MMDWTDQHCRYFHRLISSHAVLYTEMISADALLFGPREKLLSFNKEELPCVLQLGGNNPDKLSKAAKYGQDNGYSEINLNIGCPSNRVQNGSFGACLMETPKLVAECVKVIQENCQIPVTIKCRIGIDDMDEIKGLDDFVDEVSLLGTKLFIIRNLKVERMFKDEDVEMKYAPIGVDLMDLLIEMGYKDAFIVKLNNK